jgi:signal transduction histidine kinase
LGPVVIDNGQSYLLALQVEKKMAVSMLIGLPILLIVAALTGYVLMRSALRPVETMINAAEAYTFNDRHNRLPLVGAEPRIEALGKALNRMLDRLDNAYQHVSRFSADAAHELRTPLTIIRGELELIMTNGSVPPDLARSIGNAMEEMTRLSGIVESLITLSRMGSLWGKHQHAMVDVTALASETVEQMNLLAEEKNIALVCAASLPVLVAGDRRLLKQVLVNLIDNAIKYTDPGGYVRVETGRKGDRAIVRVVDCGIGIAPAQQERVFAQFYRVSTDRGEQGAGLGLALVRSICEAHGGSVTVQSALDVGSTFQVELPLLPAGLDLLPEAGGDGSALPGVSMSKIHSHPGHRRPK